MIGERECNIILLACYVPLRLHDQKFWLTFPIYFPAFQILTPLWRLIKN